MRYRQTTDTTIITIDVVTGAITKVGEGEVEEGMAVQEDVQIIIQLTGKVNKPLLRPTKQTHGLRSPLLRHRRKKVNLELFCRCVHIHVAESQFRLPRVSSYQYKSKNRNRNAIPPVTTNLKLIVPLIPQNIARAPLKISSCRRGYYHHRRIVTLRNPAI